MKRSNIIIFLFVLYSFTTTAQPRYSPRVRADRETQWMTDSLHTTPEQSKKVHDISLSYNEQMDKASQLKGKQKSKAQQKLMNKKDADLKVLLNKEQYQRYYKRENQIRQQEKVIYNGPHQPM